MLPIEILQFWIVVFTILIVSFIGWTWCYLPESRIRTLFLLFLVPYFVWGESLLWIQVLGASHPHSRIVSQLIHVCGGLFHGILGVFFIQFSNPERLHTKVCKVLLCAVIAISVTALTGWVEDGVSFSRESGLYPNAGPLLPVFNLLLLSWGIYYFTVVRFSYRAMERMSFVKAQLTFVTIPALSAIGTTLLTNVVVPGLGGTYALTPLAAFWIFLFLVSVGYTVLQGKALLIRECAREFDDVVGVFHTPSLEQTAVTLVKFVSPVLRSAVNHKDQFSEMVSRRITYSDFQKS